MSIIEINGGPVTRRYLMKKSKDDLATLYLSTLNELERLRAALQAQQGDALRDAVLEEAATRCDCLTANRRPVYARDCVDAIRAMKSDAALAARREG